MGTAGDRVRAAATVDVGWDCSRGRPWISSGWRQWAAETDSGWQLVTVLRGTQLSLAVMNRTCLWRHSRGDSAVANRRLDVYDHRSLRSFAPGCLAGDAHVSLTGLHRFMAGHGCNSTNTLRKQPQKIPLWSSSSSCSREFVLLHRST